MSQSPLIELDGVSFSPEGVDVLREVSLLSDARRIGILGRNGSGKTSLLRVMAGLVRPTSGKLRIEGVDVARDRKAALRLVGILFQNPDQQIIFPTVGEEIAFGLRQMGHPDVTAEVARVLAKFQRSHWAEAPVHHLSQGQRQLVCLMAVLAMQPRVILLDEPFSGLDIPTTLQLRRVLDGLDETLVHITHDPDQLAGYDHVIWMEAGSVHQQGTPQQIGPAFSAAMVAAGARDDLTDIAS